MRTDGRTRLPELVICTSCGVIFQVAQVEGPVPKRDAVECPCGHEIIRGRGSGRFQLEPVESANCFELN